MLKREVKEVITATTPLELDAIIQFLDNFDEGTALSDKAQKIKTRYGLNEYNDNINLISLLYKRLFKYCDDKKNCKDCPFEKDFPCEKVFDDHMIDFLEDLKDD